MDFELWSEGGPVFWLIVLSGVVALGVFLERTLHLRRARIRYEDFLAGVFNILEKRNIREALSLCDEAPGPVVHLMRTAIRHRDEPAEMLRRVLDNAGHAEISRMERRLGILATIVQIAPLISSIAGLIVAVPSYAMFNLLVIRIDRIVLDMEQAGNDILSFMRRWQPASAGITENGSPESGAPERE